MVSVLASETHEAARLEVSWISGKRGKLQVMLYVHDTVWEIDAEQFELLQNWFCYLSQRKYRTILFLGISFLFANKSF